MSSVARIATKEGVSATPALRFNPLLLSILALFAYSILTRVGVGYE